MVRKIGSAPLPVADPRDPKVLKAAQMYEAQFLREMVRAMRQTVNESQLIKTNMAEKIFREQLDDELWGPEGLQSVFSFSGESIDGLKGSIPAGEIFGKTSGPYALIEWTLMSPEDFKPADV